MIPHTAQTLTVCLFFGFATGEPLNIKPANMWGIIKWLLDKFLGGTEPLEAGACPPLASQTTFHHPV
jgi:hypothetical protein